MALFESVRGVKIECKHSLRKVRVALKNVLICAIVFFRFPFRSCFHPYQFSICIVPYITVRVTVTLSLLIYLTCIVKKMA